MMPNRRDPNQSADDPWGGVDAAERRWLEHTARQLDAAVPPFDAEASARRLRARVREDHRASTRRFDWVRSWTGWWTAAGSFGLGAAAAAAVTVFLIGTGPQPTAPVVALEGAEPSAPAGVATLQVVFRDDAPAAQIRRLLSDIGGEVVGGPGALGVWRIAVPQAQVAPALAALRASPWVHSVAP